ncbi:MAG: tetratricopeptide repeat protein, partial [Deltaproteobacteria bacterium]|nr:tetratricopeptide repeat protein [Deltaproteobacteria bacterium]
ATDATRRETKSSLYGLAFLCFVMAVLSKPVAVALPGIMVLFEISRQKAGSRWVLRRALLFVPMLAGSLVAIYVLLGAMVESGGIYPYRGGSFLYNLFLVFRLFLLNIKLMTLTVNYSPVYVLLLPDTISWLSSSAFVLLNLGLLGLAVYMFKKTRAVFFAVFWFYITILPSSNIIPISTVLADRYVYLPSFAYCLILALGFERLWSARSRKLSEDFFPALSVMVLILLLAGYSYMTVIQNRIWKDSFTLWSETLARDPKNTVAMNGLGVLYLENGTNDKALEVLEGAAEINPSDPLIRNNLGIAYERIGEYEKSEEQYQRALSLSPGHYEARINLSNLYAKRGDFQKAIRTLRLLVEERPGDAFLYFRLGVVCEEAGRFDEAIGSYMRSMELRPHIINPYENLGRLFLDKLNDPDRAVYFLKKGIEMAPNSRRREKIEALVKAVESGSDW